MSAEPVRPPNPCPVYFIKPRCALDARNVKHTAMLNNTTLSSQQTHGRSSISDLLSKFAQRKVTVPSHPCLLNPPPILRTGS